MISQRKSKDRSIHYNWSCARQYLQQTVLIIESFCLAHENAMPKLSFCKTDMKQNKVSLTLCVVNVLNIQELHLNQLLVWKYSFILKNCVHVFIKSVILIHTVKITTYLSSKSFSRKRVSTFAHSAHVGTPKRCDTQALKQKKPRVRE